MIPASKTLPAILFTLMVLFAVSENHSAPPARDKVLEEVEVLENDGHFIIDVHFAFPLRYRSHFPAERGEELRIRLLPVRIPPSDINAAFEREGVVPRGAEAAAIDQVAYEGDSEGGPYLIVSFTKMVSYEVIPGSDYRSMTIVSRSFD